MGFDLAMRHTGVSAVSEEYELLHSDVIHTPPLHKQSEIDCILNGLSQRAEIAPLLSRLNPGVVVVEGASYGSGGGASRACQLWQSAGIVKTAIVETGAQIIIAAPSTIKKHITGHGRAEKDDLIRCVKDRFGIKFDDHNACDAFCLAIWYLDTKRG